MNSGRPTRPAPGIRGDEGEDNREEDGDSDTPGRPVLDIGDKKVGTKKLAKLEAKAAKKAQREVQSIL